MPTERKGKERKDEQVGIKTKCKWNEREIGSFTQYLPIIISRRQVQEKKKVLIEIVLERKEMLNYLLWSIHYVFERRCKELGFVATGC
jgi:hypothetical protein